MSGKYILWFSEIGKGDVAKVGGKCANLGEMFTNVNVPVPGGFATTADAYRLFIKENGLWPRISAELKKIKNPNDTAALNRVGAAVRGMVAHARMPAELEKQISSAYAKMKRPAVAVRSSATAEDLPSISENEPVLVKIDGEVFYDKVGQLYSRLGIAKNIEVPSMSSNKVEWKKAEIYRHPAKTKLYKLKTRTGREITVSRNHSLLILDENSFTAKTASISDLKCCARVPCVKRLPELGINTEKIDVLSYVTGPDVSYVDNKIKIKNRSTNWEIQNPLPRYLPITNDFMYFLGIYLAEGSTYRTNGILVTNADRSVQKKVKRFFKSLSLYQNQKINKNSIRVYCKPLVRLLHAICGMPLGVPGKGRSCRIKKVPHFVFGLKKKLIGEFLRGCFDGDGYVGKDGPEVTSISKDLVGGIVKLLEILGIKCYIKKERTVVIPLSESENFSIWAGFTSGNKSLKLARLIEEYKRKPKHQDFIEVFPKSKKITELLERALEPTLHLQPIYVTLCPHCNSKTKKYGKTDSIQRYFCESCGKYFSESKNRKLKKNKIQKYVNYDERGRILPGMVPWNKGNRTPKAYGISYLHKLAQEVNSKELLEITESDILWDKIAEIKPINYDGFVYDFIVPSTENFAAGLGGVITHNTASFAGQQETYLNVKGEKALVASVKKCFASLFTDRAIFYRMQKGFSHEKVALSCAVQQMIDSLCSGVAFTIDVRTGNPDLIIIEGSWGLGEYVVQGTVTPDDFFIRKTDLKIIERRISKKEIMLKNTGKGTARMNVSESMKQKPVITDAEVIQIAKWCLALEKHYGMHQDTEWTKDSKTGKLFILQTRPETAWAERKTGKEQKASGNVLLTGFPASPGIGSGKVKLVSNLKDLVKIRHGDILVTKMTTPDMTEAMEKAVAIVTDDGGVTSHAAIISRELGVPCVVGTEKATKLLKEGVDVTVDGGQGIVFEGLTRVAKKKEAEEIKVKTKTRVYVNLSVPELAESVAKKNVDGIGLFREEFIIGNKIKEHPLAMIKNGRGSEFVNKLAFNLEKVAKEFYPRPIIVRFSDFKTNEYRSLKGGKEFEPHEENPMIGWRGCSRYITPQYEPAFRLELKAIKKARQKYGNIQVMLPFVRKTEEVIKILQIMKEEGIERSKTMKLYLMAEIPANIFNVDEFCKYCDGFSIGSNDMTQLILGVDRDSKILAKLHEFDERDPAVMNALRYFICKVHENGKTVGICGQAPSEYPEFSEFLVKCGIDSISVNPDVINKTREIVAKLEKRM